MAWARLVKGPSPVACRPYRLANVDQLRPNDGGFVERDADGHQVMLVAVRPTVPAGNTQYFCIMKASSDSTRITQP